MWVPGSTPAAKVQGENEPEMSRARGKAQAAACPGVREPSGGSASRALFASNSRQALGEHWDQLGIQRSRQIEKALYLSLLLAITNRGKRGQLGRADGRSHR